MEVSSFGLTVTKNNKNLLFTIYRKPTNTDNVIPKDVCHSLQQKQAALRYFWTRNIPPVAYTN
jgi:hypothetical protein